MTIDLVKLTATLPESAIEWRVQASGMNGNKPWARVVPYADARYLQGVLDDACGPENWRDEYAAGPCGGVLCRLSLRFNGEWVTKEDVAENTDIEAIKGGATDAFKRACVKWNVANIRCLYNLGETWADFTSSGRFRDKPKGAQDFMAWNPPKIALPSSAPKDPPKTSTTRRSPLTIDQRISGALDSLGITGETVRWHAVARAAGVDPSSDEPLTDEQKAVALKDLVKQWKAKNPKAPKSGEVTA